jgi:hypothetical protein
MKDFSPITLCGLTLILCSLGATAAHATIVYQTGFEAPAFGAGDLNGQGGWGTRADSPAGVVSVQGSVVRDGSHAVMINRTDGIGMDGVWRAPAFDGTGRIVSVSVDAYLTATTAASHWTMLATWIDDEFVHINVDGLGEIHLVNDGPIDYATGTYVTRGTWNRFEQVIDFGARSASIFYNGTRLRTATFAGTSNLIDYVQFYGQGVGSDDIGYFDNFSMRSIVPEPSSLAILLPGFAVFLVGLRRKRMRIGD